MHGMQSKYLQTKYKFQRKFKAQHRILNIHLLMPVSVSVLNVHKTLSNRGYTYVCKHASTHTAHARVCSHIHIFTRLWRQWTWTFNILHALGAVGLSLPLAPFFCNTWNLISYMKLPLVKQSLQRNILVFQWKETNQSKRLKMCWSSSLTSFLSRFSWNFMIVHFLCVIHATEQAERILFVDFQF